MPPTKIPSSTNRSPEDVLASMGIYAVDAYYFIHAGLERAAEEVHGKHQTERSGFERHISGRQLCEGLRDYAIERWGMMASAVLATWGIHRTLDFGKIVFAMIESGNWQKEPRDTIEDFTDVYDFRKAFGTDYHITLSSTRA